MSDYWSALLEAERVARAAARSCEREPLLEWWGMVEKIFRKLAVPAGDPPQPLPMELFVILEKFAGFLAVGKVPDTIANVAGIGSVGPVPPELHDIRNAVTYRRAEEQGIISDPTPVKTICEAYGCDRTTVQEWCRKYEAHDFDASTPRVLIRRMQASGARYKIAGRSQQSIRRRGT